LQLSLWIQAFPGEPCRASSGVLFAGLSKREVDLSFNRIRAGSDQAVVRAPRKIVALAVLKRRHFIMSYEPVRICW
jgi:hypothetical protein